MVLLIFNHRAGPGQAPAVCASYQPVFASNDLSMESVIRHLKQEIEYLGALAEMYRLEGDAESRAAALAARAALERLICVTTPTTDEPCPEFPAAA